MAGTELDLKLILKAVDRITAPMKRIGSNIRRALDPVRKAGARLNKSLSQVGANARRLALRMTALGVGIGFAFKRLFIDTAAQFERYQIMLQSLEGSNDAAQKSMQWVSDFAKTVPFELDDLMQAFVRLRTFGLDPTNGTLQALVDQSAKMGGSQELLQGIILAVGQAWTKQKLQGEEALQLIERGVPVWDLLAKATRLTAVQLQELSEKGKLGRGAIRLLIQEMGKSSEGAAVAQAKTWTGLVSMLSDQWTLFVNRIMGAGVFDWLKVQITGILDHVNRLAASGRLDELAREIGARLVETLRELWNVLKDLTSIAQTVGGGLRAVRDLFGSWKPVIAGIAAIIAGPLLLSLAAATKAAVVLAAVFLTNPIALAVAAIAAAALLIFANWESIGTFFKDLWEGIKDAFTSGVEFIKRLLEHSPIGLLLKGVAKLAELTRSTGIIPSASPSQFSSPAPTLGQSQGQAPSASPSQSSSPAPTLGQSPGQAQVGGTIRVEVLDNRVRVKDVRASGPVDIEADNGLMFGVP